MTAIVARIAAHALLTIERHTESLVANYRLKRAHRASMVERETT
ncbi:hypothetical protein [Brevibacterium antiquum]|uniref:Uncharacterized protein n=1 Tax=Brevibacterium antiquum TaxID=234835 RepID=A0A2H1INE2_9MICO|nr:hypothetical protein [Brevibacterium antiquum]SMX76620.1 hypothetical protein BANT10_01113 [Brevibacterium antiquum]